MLPDLGRYSSEVTASYIVSLGLLALLIALTLWRGARVRRALEEMEARRRKETGHG
ncbi:MAG: heme exporter protein CcmD [Gemmobacter sp.]